MGKVRITSFFVLMGLISVGCGKRSAQPLFGNGFIGNNQVGGDPNGSVGGNSSQTSIFTPQLVVTPSSAVAVGTTVTISVANDGALYNFRLGQTVSGLSFVGSATGVRQAYITSSVPTTVTVFATAVNSTAAEGQVAITFTSSGSTTTTTPVSTSLARPRCRISGPYYSQWAAYGALYSWSGNPQVGDSPLFTVSDLVGEPVQITNVWTLNSQETARYYYAWDRFTLNLLSTGSKTVFIKGRSFSSGATCEAQLTFNVGNQWQTPTPGPLPPGTRSFCGIYPQTGGQACTMIFRDSYFFNGISCQYLPVNNGCAARGAFGTYDECMRSVNAGTCDSW